jgi:hypothetical protein
VRENRNRLARVTLDQISEAPCALGTKIAAASWAERVQSNEPDRIIVDRIVEKVGAAEISVGREGGVQIGSSIPVAGEQINRRARFPEYCCCLGIFVFASVVRDVSCVHDHVRTRIERVQVGDGEREIAPSLIGIRGIQRQVGVGDLRNDHDAALWPFDRRPP